MSYGFKVQAPTRAAAMKAIEAKLAEVVAGQPVHAADEKSAFYAANEFLDAVPVPDGMALDVSMNGNIGTIDGVVRSASVSIHVVLVPAAQEG